MFGLNLGEGLLDDHEQKYLFDIKLVGNNWSRGDKTNGLEKTTHTEYLIWSTKGLIGCIGGYFGLFLGLSFTAGF